MPPLDVPGARLRRNEAVTAHHPNRVSAQSQQDHAYQAVTLQELHQGTGEGSVPGLVLEEGEGRDDGHDTVTGTEDRNPGVRLADLCPGRPELTESGMRRTGSPIPQALPAGSAVWPERRSAARRAGTRASVAVPVREVIVPCTSQLDHLIDVLGKQITLLHERFRGGLHL